MASLAARRIRTAALYAAQARLMLTSSDRADRQLADRVMAWLETMPSAETLRDKRAREVSGRAPQRSGHIERSPRR